MPHKKAKRSIREVDATKRGYNLAPPASNKDDTPGNARRILNAMSARTGFRDQGGKSSEDTGELPRRKKGQLVSSDEGQKNGQSSSSSNDIKGIGLSKKGKERTDVRNVDMPKIKPGEKLGDFNRRVEELLRPGVAKAIKSASIIKADQLAAESKAKKDRKKDGLNASKETDAGKEGGNKGKRKRNNQDEEELEFEDRPVKVLSDKPAPRRLNDIAQAPPDLAHLKRAGGDEEKKSAFSQIGRDPLNAGQKRLLEVERERVIKRYRELKEERENKKEKEREKPNTKSIG